MLWDFITRFLLMVFGYAYPAFQCFKTVENDPVEIEELRFWCQYWIIMAMVTILERITDNLISWFPMYSELKLAFILYLWHPKTKGTAHVYYTVLHPFVAQHENSIDRKLKEWRARAWDSAIFYWQNWRMLGQTALLQLLEFLAESSSKDSSNQRSLSSPSTSVNRAMSETQTPENLQVHHTDGQTEYAYVKDETAPTREPRSKIKSPEAAAAGESRLDEETKSPSLRG